MADLPKTVPELMKSGWETYEPIYQELSTRPLDAKNLEQWMSDWSRVFEKVDELYWHLYVEHTCHTADEAIDKQYNHFLEEIYPQFRAADQKLKEKLLTSKLEPKGFDIPLRNMRAEADLFRTENIPLLTEEEQTYANYEKIMGSQTVQWEGKELTISQMRPIYQDTNRSEREKAWRLGMTRQLADRDAINKNWQKLLGIRLMIAKNANKPDYRAWRWQFWLRFDYTPEDAKHFGDAIEEAVVPAARRIYEKRRKALGVQTLRPWDLDVDPLNREPLRPFKDVEELKQTTSRIFHNVDPVLGGYFDEMIQGNMLDLNNRKNKAPGAYCCDYKSVRKPFVFHNAVGVHDDVLTMLHEGGHAMHVFESAGLPYYQQLNVPLEFAEVASMSMEQLGSPNLEKSRGGFYTPADAARSRVEHLETNILFWPYMAVVDGFQHWVYENPAKAADSVECDRAWAKLWDRFMVVVNWSGLEEEKNTGWHRKLHIHGLPFYYIEYGLAQLGATQIWAIALKDQAKAVTGYRKALALGATATLPDLYKTAGVKLAFDADTFGKMIALMEQKISEYEKVK
jgi:oligoendopeptidase F